jgi:hypothetical protein
MERILRLYRGICLEELAEECRGGELRKVRM